MAAYVKTTVRCRIGGEPYPAGAVVLVSPYQVPPLEKRGVAFACDRPKGGRVVPVVLRGEHRTRSEIWNNLKRIGATDGIDFRTSSREDLIEHLQNALS